MLNIVFIIYEVPSLLFQLRKLEKPHVYTL